MSALPIDLPAGLVIDLRDRASAPAKLEAVQAKPAKLEAVQAKPVLSDAVQGETVHSTSIVSDPIMSASIAELVADEADLSYQAYLGDLHPAHAMRLAAISAELDRRWSTFA